MRSSLARLAAAAALACVGVVQAQFFPASPTTSGIPVNVPSKAGIPLAAGGCDELHSFDPDVEPVRYAVHKSCSVGNRDICYKVLSALAHMLPNSHSCALIIADCTNCCVCSALRQFEDEFNRYPTRTALGNCQAAIDGYPTSVARPSLWGTPMFTDRDGNEAINDAARDLPVVQVVHIA